MAAYTVKSPSGKSYTVIAPEGTAQADLQARVQQQEAAQGQGGLGGQDTGGLDQAPQAPPPPTSSPPPAPGPAAPSMDPNDPDSPNNPANGNFSFSPFGQEALGTYNLPQGVGRFMAGAGESMANSFRAGKQMAAYLSGDKDWQNQLDQEEADARQTNAPLNATTGGSAGQIAGEAAQMLLPAGELTKAAQLAKMGPLGAMLAGGAAGGIQGALQPTTGDESRGMNMVGNAAAGAAIPIIPQVLGGLKGAVLRMLNKTGAGFGTGLAGRLMGQAVEGQTVDLNTPALRGILRDNSQSIPIEVQQKMAVAIRNAEQGAPNASNPLYQGQRLVTGSDANDLYSALTKTANTVNDSNPTGAQAMNAAKRVVDASQKASLPAARYKALKLGRRAMTAGVSPYGMMTSGALLNSPAIQALNQSMQMPPDTSGNQNKPLNVNITGGTTYPAGQPPPQ